MKTIIEPFKIKMVEPIKLTTPAQRETALRNAHFNLFQVPAEDVLIDLLTDSGTCAMSAAQWSGIMAGDESYAGARSWFRFQKTLTDLTSMPHVLPTHQGRASERILFELMGGKNKIVPSNGHFDTTRANCEHSGAVAIDIPISEARDTQNKHPFKGNMDVAALRSLIAREGKENIPLVILTITNNSGGGQPVSLGNVKEVKSVCQSHGIPLFLDACRFAENAWFIKQREPGQGHRSAREIAQEVFTLADGATISAKKDGLVNIGGVLLFRDHALAEKANNLLILTEGFVTYGGLAGRDLEAMAQGFVEVLDEDYLHYRIRSTAYLGTGLTDHGIKIVQPPGGHAIYIDARDFCSHIPVEQYPGQALVVGLYRQAGIRACEIGSVMFGGAGRPAPSLELVRLAIPRRVYTQSHIDYVIEAMGELYARKAELKGLSITNEPSALRHFTARFAECK